MMKGTTTGPMKKRIRALQKKLENMGLKTSFKDAQAIATVAVYTYIQTFDDRSEKGGVFQPADPGGSGAG
jgi:hypothetical protein